MLPVVFAVLLAVGPLTGAIAPPVGDVSSVPVTGEAAPIHDTATVDETATVGQTLTIDETATIGETVTIDETVTIGEPVTIDETATIGETVTIDETATIGETVTIGETAANGETRKTGTQRLSSRAQKQPKILEVYPNPAASGDEGEFVTLRMPAETALSEYSLADDETTVSLPSIASSSVTKRQSVSASYVVTVSTDPNLTESLINDTVLQLPAQIQLANSGETVRLLHEGTVIDQVQYGKATETELYDARNDSWRPLGATELPVVTATDGTVETFVLPDSGQRAVELLESASDRIFLAGYTLSSQRVVDALEAAHERGVNVDVLVDADPVGGMSGQSGVALDELARSGISVRLLGGDRARYRYHHAKYAIVDDQALVTTENWKPSGLGGRSSRGWGIITDQSAIVDGLVETFRADAGWNDTHTWDQHEDITLTESEQAQQTFPRNFENKTLPVEQTELLVTPDNADRRMQRIIQSADQSIDIKQVSIGSLNFPLLQSVFAAAERGVEIRILLSGAWYAEKENRQLKTQIERQATARDLPITVKLAEPGGDFEKIHAKGIIVDNETTIVGSLNWNNNSLRDNREVVLVLESTEVATYYENVFDHDWAGDEQTIPVGYAVVCLLCALGALIVAVRLKFTEN